MYQIYATSFIAPLTVSHMKFQQASYCYNYYNSPNLNVCVSVMIIHLFSRLWQLSPAQQRLLQKVIALSWEEAVRETDNVGGHEERGGGDRKFSFEDLPTNDNDSEG